MSFYPKFLPILGLFLALSGFSQMQGMGYFRNAYTYLTNYGQNPIKSGINSQPSPGLAIPVSQAATTEKTTQITPKASQWLKYEYSSLANKLRMQGYLNTNNLLTPTEKHLLHHESLMNNGYRDDKEILNLATRIIDKEREFLNTPYYTFIHGQKRQYYFLEKLYTFLWSCKHTTSLPKDFLFLHIGPSYAPFLFMNYAFFANHKAASGASSAYFIKHNHNMYGPHLSPNNIFTLLDYDSLFNQFKNEITQLEKEYERASNYGNAFLIAIPHEKVNDYAYMAYSCYLGEGNYTASSARSGLEVEGIGYTKDLHSIMDALLNHPEKIKDGETDVREFCLIMEPGTAGMNPSTGIQIHPILSGAPEKLKELQKREDALFAKIKANIEEHEKLQSQAFNRAAIIATQLTKSAAVGMAKL